MDEGMLREAGLTDGESRVYLALLELGASTTGPIVEKSGVSRSIIYQLLEKLAKKGLVSHIVKEKTKHFQASEPSRIRDYLEAEEKKFAESKRKVEEMLPKLAALSQSAKPSEATIYIGFKGMVTAHEHTYAKLKPGEEYFYMGIPHDQPKHVLAYFARDHRRREKAGIRCRLLFNHKTPLFVLRDRNSTKGCEARHMPVDIDTPAWFMGYKDTVFICFPQSNSVSVEIVNQDIAHSFRAYFEEYWKRSKKVK